MSEVDWKALADQELGDFALAALPPTLKLPALPHAVTLFVQKSNEPDVSLADLARIVETDSGLTLELLRYVNSAYLGLRHKAKTAQQAISLLGLRQAKMFLISTGLQAAVQAKKSKLINQSCFWNACFQKALFAREVAKLLKTADPEVAFAGALLQDFLLPVVTNELFEEYLKFVETRAEQPRLLTEFERQTFGWDHALAGACLARRWCLPDELVCCLLFHHRGLYALVDPQLKRTAVAAVALSALLPDQLRQDYKGLEQLKALEQKWPAFNLLELSEKVDELHVQLGLGVRNDFPLSRRCRPVLNSADVYNDGTLQRTVSTCRSS